jgi:hypothetical protein
MERCGTCTLNSLWISLKRRRSIASGTWRSRPAVVRSRCGFHDRRAGYRDVVNVVRRLNPGQEVLFPNSLETHLWLVGRSVFDLDRVDKHTRAILIAAEDQSLEFVIRKTAYGVRACGECLTTDHKLEWQCYNNLAPNLCFGSRTQPKKANECEQKARVLLPHDFSFKTFGFSLIRAALEL